RRQADDDRGGDERDSASRDRAAVDERPARGRRTGVMTKESLSSRVLAGDLRAVARGISLVENESPEGAALIGRIFGNTGRAYLIGVTGPPGAGKSTLVDRLAGEYRRQGLTVGIVAVDPT